MVSSRVVVHQRGMMFGSFSGSHMRNRLLEICGSQLRKRTNIKDRSMRHSLYVIRRSQGNLRIFTDCNLPGLVCTKMHVQAIQFDQYSDCPQQAAIQPRFPGFTPQALTILSQFTAAAGTKRSEDCLTLNVWSKSTPKSSQSDKPVFVLFHGGRQSS